MIEDSSRSKSFGQGRKLSPLDRFGVWLSGRKIRKVIAGASGFDVVDIGCGFEATASRSYLGLARSITAIDVSVSDDVKRTAGIRVIEGLLPDVLYALPEDSYDIVLCISVLEHLWMPLESLNEIRRILRPGGVAFLNVPTWRGKRALEFSAFKLNLSPVSEMNDHKNYYDLKDLWPLIRLAGFTPQEIKIRKHKFGMNCYAVCQKGKIEDP